MRVKIGIRPQYIKLNRYSKGLESVEARFRLPSPAKVTQVIVEPIMHILLSITALFDLATDFMVMEISISSPDQALRKKEQNTAENSGSNTKNPSLISMII